MKKEITRIAILGLVVLMAISFVACGKKNVTADDYKAKEVKQQLADILNIDEEEITVEVLPTYTIMSYGSFTDYFDCYIVRDAKNAPQYFDSLTLGGSYDNKRIDKKDHKIWVEEIEDDTDGSLHYGMLAMKNNLVLSINSSVSPETIIDTFDFN